MEKYWNNLKKCCFIVVRSIQDNISLQLLLVFAIAFSVIGLTYLSMPRLVTLDDPLFHMRFAQLLTEQGFSIFFDFPWLYFSDIHIDQQYFIYYNFLFYIVLIPFTYIEPLYVGAQLYGVCIFSIVLTALYYILVRFKVRYPFVWLVLFVAFFLSDMSRLLTARPFTIAPILLALHVFFLYKKKYIASTILSFLYVFWHTATFFFPLGLAFIYFLFSAFYTKKRDSKIIIYSAVGTMIGLGALLLFTPGFLAYMREIIFGIYIETVIGKKVAIAEGSEVYPVDFITFVRGNRLIFIAFLMAIVFEVMFYIRSRATIIAKGVSQFDALRSTVFFVAIGFFLGIFLSRRNIDFFVIFAFLHIALTFNIYLLKIRAQEIVLRRSIVVGGILAMSFILIAQFSIFNSQLANVADPHHMGNVMTWVDKNVPDGEVIFHPTWNWFVEMFYHNPSNNYIAGIEPRFLYVHDPKLYWVWFNISNKGYACVTEECPEQDRIKKLAFDQGEEKFSMWQRSQAKQVAYVIERSFESRYIITNNEFQFFGGVLENEDYFDKLYTDEQEMFTVYKIK